MTRWVDMPIPPRRPARLSSVELLALWRKALTEGRPGAAERVETLEREAKNGTVENRATGGLG